MANNKSMKWGQMRIMHWAHKIHKIKLLYIKFQRKKIVDSEKPDGGALPEP